MHNNSAHRHVTWLWMQHNHQEKYGKRLMSILILTLLLLVLLVFYARQVRDYKRLQKENDDCHFFNQEYDHKD